MNPLIKALLIRRSREQGFAIPTIIAFGLIMTLIGTINIFKSSEENITAIAQRDTQKALTAAEAGVAYYRNLIDKNKTIAVYNSSDWANITTDPNLDELENSVDNNCGFSDQGSTAVNTATTSGWQNVNGNPDLGQYSLKSYTYAGGTGTLVVQGRDRNSTDAAAIEVSVDFPIQLGLFPADFPNNISNKVTENLNNLIPTLWIGSNNFSLNSDQDNLSVVNGNIFITKSDCDLSGIQTAINSLSSNNLGEITANPSSMPNIPNEPSASQITPISNNSDIINRNLPRSGDIYIKEKGENVFYYKILNDLNLSDTNKIQITSGAKVVFYLEGDLIVEGNVDINCNDTNDDDICDDTNNSDNLQIYGKNTTSIVEFRGSGTINIKALIHAPSAEGTITSGSPIVNITGAMWVNQWNGTNDSSMVTITSDDRYFYYTNLENLVTQLGAINPIIYPPTNWQTQEVTP
jgi:Tfp pilus assembly protein PilX